MFPVQERLIITAPFHRLSFKGFFEHEVVPVRILSLQKDGMVRIALKGQVIYAKASSQLQEGAFLLMRVEIKDNTVILTPHRSVSLPSIPNHDIFAQLGIPPSSIASALIDFFRQTELPLKTRSLMKLLSVAAAFSPHEKKAAFAAALLYSHGVEPSVSLIEQMLAGVFGLAPPSDHYQSDTAVDSDIFRCINHIKKGHRHWVVFPFTKDFDVLWKGSLAFLLDLHDTVCLECSLRVRSDEKNEAWFFALKNGECLFSCQGNTDLPLSAQKHLTKLLSSCFAAFGVSSYTVRYTHTIETTDILASIDISV